MVIYEKKQIDRQAKEANLNTSDYIREKLGLTKARKSRNVKREDLENPQGDAENAVDVEELARQLFTELGSVDKPVSMSLCRREAWRRLTADA